MKNERFKPRRLQKQKDEWEKKGECKRRGSYLKRNFSKKKWCEEREDKWCKVNQKDSVSPTI